jgi:6-methylsalicylate decarboxylase
MNHRRIDVYHHVLPPTYVAWLRNEGVHEAGGRALPEWSVQSTLDLMGRFEIETGILSVSTPGVCLRPSTGKNDEGRKRARGQRVLGADRSGAPRPVWFLRDARPA